MRNSTAYFAGVTTVFAATALGFGGAMILTSATTPRTPAEPTKLERSVAAPARVPPSSEKNTATRTEASTTSNDPAPATAAQSQQAPSPPPQPVQSTSTAVQVPVSTQSPTTTAPEQSAADAQAKQPTDAHARASDEEVRKYVRKRDRHWARRHYRDDGATTSEQASNSAERNVTPQSTSSPSSTEPPAPESQTQAGQGKTVDQTSAEEASDNVKAKRKHDRRWTRGNFRDDDQHARSDDRRSLEVREIPSEEAPQPFFGMRRWRPFFDDDGD